MLCIAFEGMVSHSAQHAGLFATDVTVLFLFNMWHDQFVFMQDIVQKD